MKKYRDVSAVIVRKNDTYLLVRKPRQDNAWQFPQGGVDDGESALDAAKRELAEECGSDLTVKLHPKKVGTYKYDFPSDFDRHDEGTVGAEVSFFFADFLDGAVEVDGIEIVEYRWCNLAEMKDKVSAHYWNTVKKWL